MNSSSFSKKLSNLLITIAEGEKHAEVSRRVLAEIPEFEPYSIFIRIDRDADGYLSLRELADFFYDNEYDMTLEDLKTFVISLSASSEEKLSYSDFLELVLPKTDQRLKQTCIQRPSFHVADDESLPYNLEFALFKVLQKEIQVTRKLEILKEDLASSYGFYLDEFFQEFNKEVTENIDFDSIFSFFKQHCLFATEDDVYAIINRTDRDNDAGLNYQELAKMVLPLNDYLKQLNQIPRVRQSPPRKSKEFSTPKKQNEFTTPEKQPKSPQFYSPCAGTTVISTAVNSGVKEYKKSSPGERLSDRSDRSDRKAGYIYNAKEDYQYKTPKKKLYSEEEEEIAYIMKRQIILDGELEKMKNQLALQKDFNLFDAFWLLGGDDKGYIKKTTMKFALNDLGVKITEDETELLVKRFDKKNEGVLRYCDFCDVLSPKQVSCARLLANRRPQDRRLREVFSITTLEFFKKTLETLINNEVYFEEYRHQLSKKPLINIWGAFQSLDVHERGYADVNAFRELLFKYDIFVSNSELISLTSKYDKDRDGRVTFGEFVQEMTPRSPQKN